MGRRLLSILRRPSEILKSRVPRGPGLLTTPRAAITLASILIPVYVPLHVRLIRVLIAGAAKG